MHVFKGHNINPIYRDLIKTIASEGKLEAKTRELTGIHICLEDPTQSLLYLKKNWKWCFQELFDRMSGIFMMQEYANPGLAYKYRPAWRRKLEKEGGRFDYAYGECYNSQVPAVINQLKKQKTSREAIINMWRADYLHHQRDFNRRPCTLVQHFIIRDKKLHCYVNMRTNDVINLLPYDIFHHTFLQRYIAHCLGIEVGPYYHFASHMYYPKKREREGRNFIEKLLFTLDNVCSERWEILPTKLNTRVLTEDFLKAYGILYEGHDPESFIKSPLIKNLVNFILDGDLNQEYNYLKARK